MTIIKYGGKLVSRVYICGGEFRNVLCVLPYCFFYLRKYLNNLNKVTSYWEQLQACLWARSHKHKSVMSRPVSLAILFTFKIEIQTGYGDCLVLLWHEYVAGVEH